MKFIFTILLFFFGFNPAFSQFLASPKILGSKTELLSPDKAFLFEAKLINKDLVQVTWGADQGYHLYHDKFKFEIEGSQVKLGKYVVPAGTKSFIPALNLTLEEHTGVFSMLIPIQGKGEFTLKAFGQGCADQGVCYPPFMRKQKLNNLI